MITLAAMLQRHAVSLSFALAISAFSLPFQASADDPVPAPPRAQGAAAARAQVLASRLAELIQKSGLSGGMGAVVADAWTGERLYTLNPETPRNPASNMKLITAATALHELGAELRLRTTLAGALGTDGRIPQLVLRGEGDPSLSFEDLLALSGALSDLGVRTVDEVLVDGSYFDDQILPPAYEQQPREIAAFRAAVAAVSVDRNAYTLRVVPGASVDAPAIARLRCPDHFALDVSMTTSASGSPTITAEQTQVGDQLALKLRGAMPIGVRGVGYERRVESPLPYAGHCLKAALRARGIDAKSVRVGAPSEAPPVLLTHESAPLAVLLQRVGKNSDNFYAEMLLKVVGAHAAKQTGSSALGIARARAFLASLGVPAGQATMVNGSGLFQGGAVSPRALIDVLTAMYRDPALRTEYVAQLAVAGKDGTLTTRMRALKKPRVVRAKTGTLDDAVALSGYVLGPSERVLAFSFLFNGVSGKQWKARDLSDAMVAALVAHLYP